MRILSLVAVASTALAFWAMAEAPARSDSGLWAERRRAAEVLRDALRACSNGEVDVDRQRSILMEAAATAATLLGSESVAARNLAAAADAAETAAGQDPRRVVENLKNTLDAMASELAFSLRVEAEQPKGFPLPTPPREIEVKRYPAYRMAKAQPSGDRAFWTLLMHIKRNGIAMTAPVEMNLRDAGNGSQEETMAFLYEEPTQGQAGPQGAVDVIDVEPMMVVSTGVRGPRTEAAVGKARQRLESWLESHAAQFAAAGAVRVLAYNSPFVPRNQNYFEVQIPLRPIGEEPAASGKPATAADASSGGDGAGER